MKVCEGSDTVPAFDKKLALAEMTVADNAPVILNAPDIAVVLAEVFLIVSFDFKTTVPPSITENTSAPPSYKDTISPVPDWITDKVEVVLELAARLVCPNWVEAVET